MIDRLVGTVEIDGDLSQKRKLMAMGPDCLPVFDVVSNGAAVLCQLKDGAFVQPDAASQRGRLASAVLQEVADLREELFLGRRRRRRGGLLGFLAAQRVHALDH